jgi:hypothetical protein
LKYFGSAPKDATDHAMSVATISDLLSFILLYLPFS